MIIQMDRDELMKLYHDLDNDTFLDIFDSMYPNLELYSFGIGWLESEGYILKFRGAHGDLIVTWIREEL